MVTPTRPKNKRVTTPYQYLDAAAADYVSGNLASSSENMWKASALAVAAVAKSYDWPHATDSDLEEVITRLERANGDDLTLWGKMGRCYHPAGQCRPERPGTRGG